MHEFRWPQGMVRLLGSFTLVVAMSLGSSSCFFKKPIRTFSPPPLPPAPRIPVVPPDPVASPPEIVVANIDPGLPANPVELPAIPGPPAPPPPKRQPVATAPKTPSTPPQPSPAPGEPAPVAPRLGQLLTDEQRREYNRAVDDSLTRVKNALVTISAKRLNADQVRIVDSIKSFQRQAEQGRDDDLVNAASLARRADLLASDLLQALAR